MGYRKRRRYCSESRGFEDEPQSPKTGADRKILFTECAAEEGCDWCLQLPEPWLATETLTLEGTRVQPRMHRPGPAV